MTLKDLLGLLSAFLAVVSYVPYLRSIFVANTRPHAFTWLVGDRDGHRLSGAMVRPGRGGQLGNGVERGVLPRHRHHRPVSGRETHITRGDWIAFLATVLAIPLWAVTSDPLWSVLLVTAIDAIAYYPTFRKSYAKPDEELAFKYVLTVVRYPLSLLALEHYTVVTSIYQVVSIFMKAGVVIPLLWRRAALGKMAA
jgi:hypothetical protein